jgi:hypothetical protein
MRKRLIRSTTSPSWSRHDASSCRWLKADGRFHILLIPKSAPHDKGHYHRTIEIGKKKLPDPGAKKQVIWGLVGSVSTDPAALKESFGAYSYETKTKGQSQGRDGSPEDADPQGLDISQLPGRLPEGTISSTRLEMSSRMTPDEIARGISRCS